MATISDFGGVGGLMGSDGYFISMEKIVATLGQAHMATLSEWPLYPTLEG